MGRFNFSNMQNKQDAPADNRFIPVEFRDAVVEVSTQPTIPAAIPTKETPEKETFAAGGFIDETGNWNDGSGIFQKKTSEEEWNSSIAGQIVNSNAYKKYFYNREEVLKEAQTMSKSLKIPENVILKDADSLAKTREIYNFQQKQMDKDAVFESYPELGKIAAKSESDAAIALHNLQNVKRVHGIFEAAATGNTIDTITKERSDIGRKLIDGKKLTAADWNRVNELEQALRDQKEIPDLLEAPIEAVVGGTAQQLPMLLRQGIKAQPYGLATGMIGGVIGGAATGGVGTGVGFAQGYKTGVKIGYGVEMFKEIAGGYALDYMRYKDKQGNRLFTDNEASTFAIATALLEAGIELSNYDLVLKTLGGGSAVKRIRDIVSSAQDTASARARLLTMIKDKAVDTGKVAVSESMEEAVQQLATDTVQNVAAIYKPYGNLRVLKDHEMTRNAVQAFWQALPASIGLGAGAAGMNSIQVVRDAAHAMAESKQHKEQRRIANEQNVLAQLYEERDNSELSQKSPETFDNLVQENVQGTKYENVYIDTEIANEDKETRIVLNQLAQAAGITEEEVAVINETGAKLSIPTSVFVRSIEDVEVRRKLQNLISFDEAEDCFVRNKRTAKAAIKEMERIAEENVKRQAQAITNIVGETFSDEYERSLAEFIIFQNPDMTPYEAYKKYKAEAKQELEAQIAPIMQQMREGMGNGITEYWADRETGEEADVGDLIGKQETQEGGSFKHIRVSNNAPWLQKFVKQNGKSPSQKDMKKIAIDILKGYDEYSVYGLDMNNADMDDLAKTKATIEEIQNRLAALERMDAKMKTVDQADIEALESLSPEAVQVYRDLKDKLSQGNKEVRAAARVGALVWAYRCDRFAQYMQKAGHKDYTALDYYKRLQLDAASNAGVGDGYRQDGLDLDSIHIGTDTYVQRPAKEVIDTYYELKEQSPFVINGEIRGETVKERKECAKGIYQSLYKDKYSNPISLKNKYAEDIVIPFTGFKELSKHAKKPGLFEIVPHIEKLLRSSIYLYTRLPEEDRDKRMKSNVLEYRVYGRKAEINGLEYYVKILVRKEKSNKLILHDVDVFERKKEADHSGNGGADHQSASKPDESTSVKHSIPWWIDEVKTKLISVNDVQQKDNTFEQRAYYSSYNQSVGTRAVTADKQLLEQAKNMEAEGAGREEIYKVTGWHKGVDGMWRFEIPDNLDKIDFSKLLDSGNVTLGEIYDNPQLYKAYPFLADILVLSADMPDNVRGSVSYYGRYATSASIQLNKKHFVDGDAKATHKNLASTLIHEIQHLIQDYEGFASGGSQSKVRKQIENTLATYDDELRSISPEAKQYYAAYDRYNSLKLKAVFGEVTQEELKEAENELRDSESKVSEAERKHIKRIKALRYQLQKQQDNKALDDIDAYLNLAGEQEARAATEKADLAKRIVNEESEENAEELQKQYDDAVLNGVNEMTAIVVFNGGEVARLDADNVVIPVVKGQTDLLSNGERIVRLFATADQSTFLHESAHIFYEDMRELAQDAKAPEELKKDFAKLSEWCRWREDSIKDYEGSAVYKEFSELDKQIKSAKDKPEQAQLLARWEQERFARAFEEYLKQGSAPTKGLAKAFAQLKKWLVKIYRGFISVGAVPSKDVTDIMDRMLVSEEEADRYRKELDLEGFRREGGLKYLNDNVAQMWEQTYLEAVDAAKAKVMKIAMRDITDKNKKERVEKLNKEREQERERLSHDPVFIVWKALQNKDLAGIGMTEMCKNVGITVEEYAKRIKEYGGSLEAAVEDHMWLYERELKEMDIEELKAEARKALDSSYYRKLLNSFEAEFLETAIRKEQRLSRKILRREQLTEQELKEADVLLAKLDKRKDKEHAYWKSVREEIVRYKKKLKEDYKEQASASVKAYREEADKRAMRNLDEKEDRGRRALRDAVKNHSADIKGYAEKALAKLSIKDGAAVPGIWRKKAKERSQQCNYYISKFDWQKARDAKVMELIYNTMADIAQANHNKVKRKADALKRRQNTIQREKNLPAKERYLYNHLLYMVGLAKADAPKPQGFDFQEMVASYKGDMEMAFIDADGNITLSDWFIGTAFGDAAPQNVNNLKMAQFKELADFMDNLYTVGVNAKQFKTVTDFDGKKVTIEDAAMAIALGNKAGYNNDPDITKAGSETAIEKAVRWGRRSYLSLVKAETIFRTVGAECMHYCYDPIKQAADNELKETELLVQRLQTIRKNYRKSVKQRLLNQLMIESPGMDTKQAEEQADKAADKYMDELTEKKYVLGTSKVSRENILAFALNWGTEKNRLRVVDGFSEDRQKIDAADIENLLKELNGADWTFVTDIWKLFDFYWPRLQDVESRMTGVTMEKEKAVEFSILGKDNQVYILDGGYYPIKYDRDKNVQTLQQANDEAARMNMSGSARLGTKLGQTKARSNFNVKGRKIRVDLDVVAEVLSDNIHIITMREAVRDVNRIINHPVFKGMVENSFGKETYTMLQQWVLDCWAREQRSVEWLEVLAQHLRTKQTMAVLGFRTTTALLNILNIAPMADYLGVTRTLKAIKDYYIDKLTNGGKQYEMCMEKSVFLRNRAQTMDRDMRSVIEKQNSVMGGKLDNIQKSAFYFITQTDLMLACPLWISEYQRVYRELVEENAKKRAQLDKQGTENPDIIIKTEDVIEREAVNAGDAAVRRVFGSGQIQDLAAVQKGSEVTKMFTMYYSYFSVVLNALDYKFRETRNKKRTEAMAHIAMGFLFWIILPAVGDTLIRTLISGNDDDKEPEEILKRTGTNILNSTAGGIPILRDVVPALTNYALTGKFYGTGGTVFDETMGQTMRILSAIKSDSKDGYDVARESLKLFDNMSGFPQTVTDGIISAMEFIHYGEFTAESIREYLWAIVFDKGPEKKK